MVHCFLQGVSVKGFRLLMMLAVACAVLGGWPEATSAGPTKGVAVQEGLFVPADEFEPDNELEQANWLYNDEVEAHTLDHAEDRDWFLLSAGPGTDYLLSTYVVDGSTDTVIQVYGPDKKLIFSDDDSNEGLNGDAQLWLRPQVAGYYYLLVMPKSAGSLGAYGVEIVQVPAMDRYEHDGAQHMAEPLRSGEVQEHTFHLGSDVDWLKFSAAAGNGYVLETEDYSERTRTTLGLYDASGQLLAAGVAGGSAYEADAQIRWIAPDSGTYYLCVTSFARTVVPCYEVTMREMPDGNHGSSSTALLLDQHDVTRYDLLNSQGDEDWFAIPLRPEARLAVTIVPLAPTDLECALLDASGLPVGNRNEADGEITFTVSGIEPVYLQVSDIGGELGFYKLVVDYQATSSTMVPDKMGFYFGFWMLTANAYLRPEDYQAYAGQDLRFTVTVADSQGRPPTTGQAMHGQGLDLASVPLDAKGVAELPALSPDMIERMTSNGCLFVIGISVPPGDYTLTLDISPEGGPVLCSHETSLSFDDAPALVALRNRNNRVVELVFDQELHTYVYLRNRVSLLFASGEQAALHANDTVTILGDHLSIRFATGLPEGGVQIVLSAGALQNASGAAIPEIVTDPIQPVMVGDLTGDGKMDIRDLAELATRYGQKAPADSYDLNVDGTADLYDLVLLSKQL